MTIKAETTTVYKGARRRFFSPKGAANDLTIVVVKRWYEVQGEEMEWSDRDRRAVSFLARIYLRQFKASTAPQQLR